MKVHFVILHARMLPSIIQTHMKTLTRYMNLSSTSYRNEKFWNGTSAGVADAAVHNGWLNNVRIPGAWSHIPLKRFSCLRNGEKNAMCSYIVVFHFFFCFEGNNIVLRKFHQTCSKNWVKAFNQFINHSAQEAFKRHCKLLKNESNLSRVLSTL